VRRGARYHKLFLTILREMNKGMHNHNTSNAELFLNPSMAIRGPGHTKLFEARTCESHMSIVKGKGGVFAAKGV